MNRRQFITGLTLSAASLAGGRGLPEARAASFDDIVAQGRMTVAVYRDFPPFSEQKDGRPSGVDVDLAQAIGQHMKLAVDFMELTAGESVDDDLRNGVWKGHYIARRVADVMMHVPTDRALALRNPNAVIFAPYYRERIALARNPERIGAGAGIEAFDDEKVGVEVASLPDVYLTSAFGGRMVGNVVHFHSLQQAVRALVAGQVAAVMGTETELAAALGADKSRFPVGVIPLPGLAKPAWELGLAVKDSNRQLANALDDVMTGLRRDGTVAAIFQQHGLPWVKPETD